MTRNLRRRRELKRRMSFGRSVNSLGWPSIARQHEHVLREEERDAGGLVFLIGLQRRVRCLASGVVHRQFHHPAQQHSTLQKRDTLPGDRLGNYLGSANSPTNPYPSRVNEVSYDLFIIYFGPPALSEGFSPKLRRHALPSVLTGKCRKQTQGKCQRRAGGKQIAHVRCTLLGSCSLMLSSPLIIT